MPTPGTDATGDTADDGVDDETDETAEDGVDDETDETAEDGVGNTAEDDAAEAALSAAIDDANGHPACALCSKPADYFLYETDHVEKFVCWEHVSPHSAAVDGEDARPGRPLALSL